MSTPGQGWQLSDKKNDLVYDAQHNLISYSQETSNPPSTSVTKTSTSIRYNSGNLPTGVSHRMFYGSSWITYGYDTITYDANNNQTSYTTQVVNNLMVLVTQNHFIATYDAHNNKTSEIDSNMVQYSGVTTFRITRHIIETFDANNNKTSSIDTAWMSDGSFNLNTMNRTFDASNNVVTDLQKIWYSISPGWTTTVDHTTTYDSHHNIIRQTNPLVKYTNTYDASFNLLSQEDSASKGRVISTYDSHNNKLSITNRSWNGTSYVTTGAVGFTFDVNNNLTSKIDSTIHWSGGTASPILTSISRIFNTYDANNNLTSVLTQSWGGGIIYKDNSKNTYTYDANNNKYIIVQKNYDNTGAVSGDSTYFYAGGTTNTGINKISHENISFNIYPNPASSELNISSTNKIENVEVYNLTGMLLSSSSKTKIDISELPQGVYFVKVFSENGVTAQKFVKQ
jgi:hypothetical protein